MNMRADKDLIKYQINKTLVQKGEQRALEESIDRVQDIGPGAFQSS